jgi:hypothetical protein
LKVCGPSTTGQPTAAHVCEGVWRLHSVLRCVSAAQLGNHLATWLARPAPHLLCELGTPSPSC